MTYLDMLWLVPLAYFLFLVTVVQRYSHRRPHLKHYVPRTTGPLVTVIIPARDEAANIEACVRSVLATTYQPIEVLVVDDRSSDATAAIVERFAASAEARGRLQLVPGAELPTGWFGKPWALVQGFREARGELILFADADTRHTPDLLPRAIAALETEDVDLVSVIPRQGMETFWERLVQPHVFLALASRVGGLERINRTRIEWDAIANGQFILVARQSYVAVGTHHAVKDKVAEDMALAQAYVRHGLDIFLVHAPEYMTTRMYRSLSGIIEGWSKNLARGVPLTLPPIRWLRRAAPYLMWLPSLVWVAPPVLWALTGGTWAAMTVTISLAVWVAVYRAERAPLRYALLYPLGAAMVAYIMLRSTWRGGRKIEWRGRLYSEPRA
ncbi:MAG TPA: glycosyltransferase family 2 protein [Gemmatimonadales bacterium]|nr:glycosyltransferase family 2 protein [Gemmatimonadales bacterium]